MIRDKRERVKFCSPWVDSIPRGWGQVKLGHIGKIYSGGTPDKKNDEYWTNGTVPWLNSGAVNQGFITEVSDFISEQALENSSARWVPAGSLVMALAGQGKTKGMVAQLGIDATCNQSMAAIVLDEDHPRYIMYWLASNYRNIRGMASDDTRDGLNLTNLKGILCPQPDMDEQLAIANYLDTESKRIDGLIEEKLKLKELLIELRVATISDAVAKGLDSNVRKKNSGVAWLGEIPEHWQIKRVKHIARFTTGWTPPTGNAAFYIGANPWANIGDLGPKLITETANQISDEAVKNTGINISPIGSLLFSFKLSVGQVSIAGQSMFTNEAIATFPPQDDFDIQWAFYAFPKFIPENAAINIYGAKLLNQQRINDALLPFPPKNEQIAIANYLDSETKRMDGLIEHVDSEIELLKELRASTITDAVLGRIDVQQAATH